jgi:hypothetical protein
MDKRMLALLKDLAEVLKKHDGGLGYTRRLDGIHVYVGDSLASVCIGRPSQPENKCDTLHKQIKLLTPSAAAQIAGWLLAPPRPKGTMTITINQSANDLDPGATVENPCACLEAYFSLCSEALAAEWPEADIVCNDVEQWLPLHCSDWDEDDYVRAQEICSDIYATGMFWL